MNDNAYTDQTIMNFGKYKGKPLEDVPAHYLIYILENDYKISKKLKVYIQENMDVLQKELNGQ